MCFGKGWFKDCPFLLSRNNRFIKRSSYYQPWYWIMILRNTSLGYFRKNHPEAQHGYRVASDWESWELQVNSSFFLSFHIDHIFSQATETSISNFVLFFKNVLQSVLIIIFLSGTKFTERLFHTYHKECSSFLISLWKYNNMHNKMIVRLIFSKLSAAYLLFSLLLCYFHSFQYHGQTIIKTQNIYRVS